jgi:transcriptional regulator with GAF, ATPase, and Fis domain
MAYQPLGAISASPHPRISVPILEQLVGVVGDQRGEDAANRLCEACLALFDADAAAICLVVDGAHAATLGASGPTARVLDELQFTLGEGPALDAVTRRAAMLVTDLAEADGTTRWPTYRHVMGVHGIRFVYSIPIAIVGHYVGALTLFRAPPGMLSVLQFAGARVAAELAEMPILDLAKADLHAAVAEPDNNSWTELAALTRTEVNQATGMLVAQLNIEPAVAVVRLRAHAYATDRTPTDVARDILAHRLQLEVN